MIKNPRIKTNKTHGTGSSLNSSISAFLTNGNDLEHAFQQACQLINRAIHRGRDKKLGIGNGPINYFNLK
jgi:hydroxymethylpyrimidine/phosphomethylpyrimidine kinase